MKRFDTVWCDYVQGCDEEAQKEAQAVLLAAFAAEPVLAPIRWQARGGDRSDATATLTIGDLTIEAHAVASFTGRWHGYVGRRCLKAANREEARQLAEKLAVETLHEWLATHRRAFVRAEKLARLAAGSAELAAARDEANRLQALANEAHAARKAVEARLEAEADAE